MMPALKPTDIYGEITWIGTVPAGRGLQSVTADRLTLTYAGPAGEAHSGLTRPSCVRVKSQWPQGTEIRNVRQLSVLSQEELDAIAADCGLDHLDPGLLGATLVLRGIPDFTHIPPSSRLQAENLTTLVVDMENRACVLPGREIEIVHQGAGAKFKTAATHRRGVTAWVEHEGALHIGDRLRLHVPDQRAWLSQPDLFS